MRTKKHPAPTQTASDRRWQDVVNRNPNADGRFMYAVKTTGIYCRPSCHARLARPENVVFYDHWQQAQMAGYRPCCRCQPQQFQPAFAQAQIHTIEKACRLIEQSSTPLTLQEISTHVGLSPSYFQRLFKQF